MDKKNNCIWGIFGESSASMNVEFRKKNEADFSFLSFQHAFSDAQKCEKINTGTSRDINNGI